MSIAAYHALRSTAGWIDLSARGKLLVSGEDAARLLHAISTNHINELAPDAGLYTFFLNDKGRILADSYIFRLANGYFLDTEPETATFLRDHIDRYIIADDAYVTDEAADWAVIGLEGPESHQRAADLNLAVPAEKSAIAAWADGFVANVASAGIQGVRIWVRSAKKQDLINRLIASGIFEAPAEEARVVRIENGVPRYGEDITDRFLVQETQTIHAVHFSKGCYLGQEIVERVRSRGQVHRFLAALRLETANTPDRGAKLLLNGAPAGEITSAAYSPALGKIAALGYVRSDILASRSEMLLADSVPPVSATVA